MAFCINCGQELAEGAKFCAGCGKEVNDTNSAPKREIIYEGNIHKCPNCGEILKSFMTNCPACGFELNRKEITSSLKEFVEKINKCDAEITNNSSLKTGWSSWSKTKRFWWIILNMCFVCIPLVIYLVTPLVLINKTPKLSKEEKQMANLIENFPFPNDRESILAALVFAKEKINFLSKENVDRKSAYWLRLWISKSEQLKQKANMLFPNDSIVKSSYDDIIVNGNRVNKIIKIKAIFGLVILVLAIIFIVSRYDILDNVGITNQKDYNAIFEWQTNGLFEKLPKPDKNNGTIVSETEKQIQFELYNITTDDFNEYVKRCRTNGFSYDVTKNDSVFYADDENGYNLNIFYDSYEKVMKIFINSYYLSTDEK